MGITLRLGNVGPCLSAFVCVAMSATGARADEPKDATVTASDRSGAEGEARPALKHLEPEVTSETTAQFYDVRSPTGATVLARRRFTSTLGASVYDLLTVEKAGDPELTFRTRVRYDADYGASSQETDAQNPDRLIPGFSRGPIDVMYAYVEGRRFAKGWLGFRIGRQYMTDALGWWSFDGAQVRLTTPFYVAVELYGGTEQRGGLPLSLPRYERDGVWRGSRDNYDPQLWAPYQPSALAPAYGAAVETTGVPWFHARLSYRRVNNTGAVSASDFASGTFQPSSYKGMRVSSERVGASFDGALPELGGIRLGGSYDMFMTRMATAFASADYYATKKLTLSVDYDYYQPSFDADSIWNFFIAEPMNDVSLRGTYDATEKLSVSVNGRTRIFQQQITPETTVNPKAPVPSPNLSTAAGTSYYPKGITFNGGGGLSARYRWKGDGLLGARGDGAFGPEGDRVGGDLFGERVFDGKYVAMARTGVWNWKDKLRADRGATAFNYVLGTGYVLTPKSRILIDFEHNIDRISGQRFRAMAWLTLALAK